MSVINIENIGYTQTTIFDEKYQKESFNVILAFNILHLPEDAHNDIQRTSELLIPGGILVSTTPCLGQKCTSFFWRIPLFSLRILLFLANKVRITPYVRFLKISELEEFITRENFQIVETEILSESPPHYFIAARKL